MKLIRSFSSLFIIVMLLQATPISAATYPETNGKAVILMDAYSGRVLYERNSHEQLPPASLTKIMTALLVAENGDLEQPVTASEHAAATPESSIYLEPGEVLSRMELLYAAMLPSANDACTALAESIAGDEDSFVAQMNKRAAELGLKDTHFLNPHGLEAEGHYSSAYDLALLSKEALSHQVLAQIMATEKKVIPWAGKDEDRILLNHNRLLYNYDGAIGVKTGYTRQAGNCVVGAAQRGDMVLIAVTMNSPTVYNDLQQMLDYGFEQYKMVTLGKTGEVSGTVDVKQGVAAKVKATLARNLSIAATDEEIPHLAYSFTLKPNATAPIEPGEVLGTCRLYLKGEQIGSVDMVAGGKIGVKPSLMETSGLGRLATAVLSKWRVLCFGLMLSLVFYLCRRKLEEALKQIILFVLPARIKEQHRNHRF
jgi:D-alanyl-D-alanine carboxypeptidase (penicillin-binding protein 5/6)